MRRGVGWGVRRGVVPEGGEERPRMLIRLPTPPRIPRIPSPPSLPILAVSVSVGVGVGFSDSGAVVTVRFGDIGDILRVKE